MSGSFVFNSTTDSQDGVFSLTSPDVAAQQFESDTTSGHTLSNVTLFLSDLTPGDGGTVSVSLLSDNLGVPGTLDSALGTIADSSLSTSVHGIDLAVTGVPALSPSTQYWIEVSGNASSGAGLEFTTSTSDLGTGVANEYNYSYGVLDGTLGETLELDSNGGTFLLSISESLPCFARGTRILTSHGEVAVEDLRIDDEVLTACGTARPIRWIGRRSYSGRFASSNRDVLPVCVRAGALADGVPHRDLWLSPLHAIFLDGMLIPASALVNGLSIVQAQSVDQIEYFHVELDSHDVIHAEGALSETFVDDDGREMFQNAAEFRMLYPDAVRVPPRYCAPRVEDGEELETVRRRIAMRALPSQDSSVNSPPGRLRGCLDSVCRERIAGWAADDAFGDAPVNLRILDGGVVIGEVLAHRYREDLEKAGIGSGRHGFLLTVQDGLSPLVRHVIQVQRASDGSDLHGSPWVLEAAPHNSAPSSGGAVDADPTVAAPSLPSQAGPRQARAAAWRGCVDKVSRDVISGWAQDASRPGERAALLVLDNGAPIARVLANRYRQDLEKAGIGDGRHGFEVQIPGGLSPLSRHVIHVRREADGGEVQNSPAVIEAATSFDAALERAVDKAVASLGADGEEERVLSFLLAQADRLLQQRAEAEGKREARLAYQQFQRRWGATRPAATVDPGLRALVVDDETPVANRDAGSQAILSHMRSLQELGYAVSFVAGMDMARTGAEVESMEAEGIVCCRAPFYATVEDVLRRQAQCFDVVYLHRASNAAKYLALARQYCPKARIIYSVADLHHVRLARQAQIEDRPELSAQSRQLRLAECVAARSADAVITHSTAEAAVLRQAVPGANVHVVPWTLPVRPVTVPFAQRRGVAFIGSYAHSPNVDAAHFLAEAVMPLVWQRDRTIECLLVGSRMPEAIQRLARPGLVAVGHVAALSEVFDRVRLTVAPLRFGAGVKGKVLESFAAGVPCVMSEIAAEGLLLSSELQGLVGGDAAALAALICRLHTDASVNAAAATSGLSLIDSAFTAPTVSKAMQAVIAGQGQPAAQSEPRRAVTAMR
jgi:glycosyltransferase involved in cell wall biosynthesis